MTRTPPDEISPPDLSRRKVLSDTEELSVQLKLLTPMFGGSAIAREVDMETPIRAAAIRGHLRFWWRATVGAQFVNSEDLFQQEARVWGSADLVSPIKIQIDIINKGNVISFNRLVPNDSSTLGYSLFPFREVENEDDPSKKDPPRDGRINVEFSLVIKYPKDLGVDVLMALRAWTFFGGIGARTRRGCGAISVLGGEQTKILPGRLSDVRKQFFVSDNNSTEPSGEFPTVAGSLLFINTKQKFNAEKWRDCLTKLIRFWKEFRSNLKDDNKVLVSLGNSKNNELHLDKPYLGLPIQFKNISGKEDIFEGEMINADGRGKRFASPVILKPCVLSNGDVYPMVVIMQSNHLNAVKIHSKEFLIDETYKLNDQLGNTLIYNNLKSELKKAGYTEAKL